MNNPYPHQGVPSPGGAQPVPEQPSFAQPPGQWPGQAHRPGPGPTPGIPWPAGALAPATSSGWGRLVVDCSYNVMGVLLAATGPGVYVDGVPRGFQWGKTVVDLPAGQHHLHVHTRYMGQMGKADATVHLAPNELVHLYYRAPLTVFSKGRLGPNPQRSGGVGTLVGVSVSAVAVVLLVVLIALLG